MPVLWGAVRAGHKGWPAHGGHGNGRKLLIVLAGLMLDDPDMQNPYAKYPNLKLSEDISHIEPLRMSLSRRRLAVLEEVLQALVLPARNHCAHLVHDSLNRVGRNRFAK